MSDTTKQELENLMSAMKNEFNILHTDLEVASQERKDIRNVLDDIAGRVDDLWTDNGAQVISNRRVDVRLSKLEAHVGLETSTL